MRIFISHLALGEGTAPVAEALSCIRFHNPEVTCTIECSTRERVLKSWEWLQPDRGRCGKTG